MVDGFDNCAQTIEPNTLHIGQGVKIEGDVSASRLVIVEGTVEGRVTAHAVWIGPSGSVKGRLCVTEAEIHGLALDNVVVTKRLRIHPTGRVIGDVSYCDLILEKGAVISGKCAPINPKHDAAQSRIDGIEEKVEPVNAGARHEASAAIVAFSKK